ncbi:hypothetical protein BJ508DRAFT_308012 [Ascobolus immersus RN42]|uniref:Uncharacterized protein n=1 Tax=Ascobolus immersus RN42 TaxID=1160509 RepID=A0A3N4I1D0_ASCIM|nr:hypothetical protein BJ508DRAFT_308012 [Ascobolus immersus RN42]
MTDISHADSPKYIRQDITLKTGATSSQYFTVVQLIEEYDPKGWILTINGNEDGFWGIAAILTLEGRDRLKPVLEKLEYLDRMQDPVMVGYGPEWTGPDTDERWPDGSVKLFD